MPARMSANACSVCAGVLPPGVGCVHDPDPVLRTRPRLDLSAQPPAVSPKPRRPHGPIPKQPLGLGHVRQCLGPLHALKVPEDVLRAVVWGIVRKCERHTG